MLNFVHSGYGFPVINFFASESHLDVIDFRILFAKKKNLLRRQFDVKEKTRYITRLFS